MRAPGIPGAAVAASGATNSCLLPPYVLRALPAPATCSYMLRFRVEDGGEPTRPPADPRDSTVLPPPAISGNDAVSGINRRKRRATRIVLTEMDRDGSRSGSG